MGKKKRFMYSPKFADHRLSRLGNTKTTTTNTTNTGTTTNSTTTTGITTGATTTDTTARQLAPQLLILPIQQLTLPLAILLVRPQPLEQPQIIQLFLKILRQILPPLQITLSQRTTLLVLQPPQAMLLTLLQMTLALLQPPQTILLALLQPPRRKPLAQILKIRRRLKQKSLLLEKNKYTVSSPLNLY